jgi:hypothetical protein
MSEVINQPEINAPSTVVANELELLKARADKLGIKYSPNIGIETLKERINAVLSPEKPAIAVNAEDAERTRVRKDALKLIRCQIVNLNPNKKAWEGEIITVWNKYTGTVRKFVPFGEKTVEGYHVPQIIYNVLKERKYLSISTKRDPKTGELTVKTQWVPEFSLTVLPQLTKEQLAELAAAQKASGSIPVSDDFTD